MSTPVAPRTELQAVNIILKAAGKRPVSSISVSPSIDVVKAKETLDEAISDVLSKGYTCLTTFNRKLPQDVNGEVWLPNNTHSVTTTGYSADLRLVERGGRLYDIDKGTSVIGQDVYVNIVEALPYEDLPTAVRRYVTYLAAHNSIGNSAPGDEGLTRLDRKVQMSLVLLEQADAELRPDSLRQTNTHYVRRRR